MPYRFGEGERACTKFWDNSLGVSIGSGSEVNNSSTFINVESVFFAEGV